MHLIDEEDDVAVLLHFVHKSLDAAFKLAAELRTGDERREIQKLHFFFAQLRGHFACRNAQGKPLCNGRFTDARLTDETRIILCAAGQNLHHTLNLALAADDGIQLAVSRLHGEVGAVRCNVLTLRFVEVLLLFLVIRLAFAGCRLCAVTVCVHTELTQQFGRERHRAARLKAAVVGHRHQIVHAFGHRLQLLLRDAHFLHNIIHRLNAELFCADKAVALRGVHIR